MDALLLVLLFVVLIGASICDIRTQKIPNLLVFPAAILAVGYYGITDGLNGLLFSAGGLAIGTGIFLLPYVMGAMGAGDAKLMGAVGAVLGPQRVFIALLFTALAGGIYALLLLIIRYRDCKGFLCRSWKTLRTLVVTGQFIVIPAAANEKKPSLYYGVAIAVGTFCSLWWQPSNQGFVKCPWEI